jgi:photoactive yellow protein
MLTFEGLSTPVPFMPENVDQCSDAELDAASFGVICLDAEGTILRYNLYESRFARIDRNQVMGRNFFGEVARCTRGEKFEGRFRRVVAGTDARSDRFEFLFDFAFGAQRVVVEILSVKDAPRFYLFINRVDAEGPRPGLGPDDLAVEQRALAPDEARFGVRRDAVEMRVIELPWSFLAALRATCGELAPESWPMLCQEWGQQWGRRAAVDLESTSLETSHKGLRERSMRAFTEVVAEHLRNQGWGHTTFDFTHAREGLLSLDVERSALAESTRLSRPRAKETASPDAFACHLLAGCFGALLSHVAQRKIAVREITCASLVPAELGAVPRCTFVAVGQRRRKALESSLEGGARDVETIRQALRKATGSGG